MLQRSQWVEQHLQQNLLIQCSVEFFFPYDIKRLGWCSCPHPLPMDVSSRNSAADFVHGFTTGCASSRVVWFGVVVISRPPSSFHVKHPPSSPLVIVSGQLFPGTTGHRISDRHRGGINISKIFSNRRHNWHGDGTSGANHDGPEERRSVAGCPATVLERGGPKDGR